MAVAVVEGSRVSVGVGKTGEGLVYCSHPVNTSEKMIVMKIRPITMPERDLLIVVILPV